ncbi:MAG TPA: hypothetical protein VGM76_04690 [Lacipirellulaceae bacterium]|jgi:hypothetical protein
MSSTTVELPPETFVDRRTSTPMGEGGGRERRQFANSHDELSPEAAELARAIDGYKLQHRRRFITFEEMLSVVKSLGYSR